MGTHALVPLSFKAAAYSGVFTLLPLLTGEGREHHGEILREATRLMETGWLLPRVDTHAFSLCGVEAAHRLMAEKKAIGKVVVTVS